MTKAVCKSICQAPLTVCYFVIYCLDKKSHNICNLSLNPALKHRYSLRYWVTKEIQYVVFLEGIRNEENQRKLYPENGGEGQKMVLFAESHFHLLGRNKKWLATSNLRVVKKCIYKNVSIKNVS